VRPCGEPGFEKLTAVFVGRLLKKHTNAALVDGGSRHAESPYIGVGFALRPRILRPPEKSPQTLVEHLHVVCNGQASLRIQLISDIALVTQKVSVKKAVQLLDCARHHVSRRNTSRVNFYYRSHQVFVSSDVPAARFISKSSCALEGQHKRSRPSRYLPDLMPAEVPPNSSLKMCGLGGRLGGGHGALGTRRSRSRNGLTKTLYAQSQIQVRPKWQGRKAVARKVRL